MKQKILAALKTKYANKGFGDKAFDGVAEFLSKTVTDEAGIETAIAGVEVLLTGFQSEADKVRTEKAALQKLHDEYKAAHPEAGGDPNKNEPKKDFTLEDIQKLIDEKINPFTQKVQTFEQTQQQAARMATIKSKAAELGIPESVVSKFRIEDSEDIDAAIGSIKQELTNFGFNFTKVPDAGSGPQDESKAIADQISEGTKKIVEETKK